MKTLKFKTNIKCMGCVSKTTPFLNETVGEDNWDVDIQDPGKILTVAMDEVINPGEVILAVEAAGYQAEVIE